MNEQIKNIFKPVFDSNDALKRLICGDLSILDGKSFEELCELGYIIEEIDDAAVASMNEGKPCMLMFGMEEGVFGSKYISVQIACRHDAVYMGGTKLRYFEIIAALSDAIHQKVEIEGGVLELETFKSIAVDDTMSIFAAAFRTNSDSIEEKTEPKILSFYKEELFPKLKEAFEYNEVSDMMCIGGISGSEMSLEDLITRGYVRLSPATDADFTKKNIYAVLQLEHLVSTQLTMNVFASCSDGDSELMKAELGMATSMIAIKLTSDKKVVLTSNSLEELSDSVAAATLQFSMDATEEDAQRIENRNKIDIRFFADAQVLQAVPGYDITVGTQKAGIAVDLIDGPYRLTFANKDKLEFGFHMRYPFGVDDNPAFKIAMKSDDADPEIASEMQLDQNTLNMLMAMYISVANLSAFLDSAAITDKFAEMDVEKEGILLYVDKNEIKFKRLSGAQRPDLPVNNMGQMEMGRPYADEAGQDMGGSGAGSGAGAAGATGAGAGAGQPGAAGGTCCGGRGHGAGSSNGAGAGNGQCCGGRGTGAADTAGASDDDCCGGHGHGHGADDECCGRHDHSAGANADTSSNDCCCGGQNAGAGQGTQDAQGAQSAGKNPNDDIKEITTPLNQLIAAGEDGDVAVIEQLMKLYSEGVDRIFDENSGQYIAIAPDCEKEFYWNEKGVQAGSLAAMFNKGLYYAKGCCVERDFAEAAKWMRKAQAAGDDAAYAYAEVYESMPGWIAKAEAGDAVAQGMVAHEFMSLAGALNCCDAESDYAEALKWAELAQGKDNGEAYLVLGMAYEAGRGREMDKVKAVEYYKKGADMGHAVCANNYGLAHVLGQGAPMDKRIGFEYFLKAAEMGYGYAMQNVAMCYESADGTNFDLEKAIEWYEKSLEVLPNSDIEIKVRLMKEYLNMNK